MSIVEQLCTYTLNFRVNIPLVKRVRVISLDLWIELPRWGAPGNFFKKIQLVSHLSDLPEYF
jgi:hypothetical protein